MMFQPGELSSVIKKLEQENFTGTATLTPDSIAGEMVTKVLAFWNGGLTFAGNQLPSPVEFAEFLKQKLNLSLMDSAVKVAENRVKNKDSVRELIDFINRFGLIKWDTIEPMIHHELVLFFEPLLMSGGILQLDTDSKFDLSYGHDLHGFAWAPLQEILVKRQNLWQSFLPLTFASIVVQTKEPGMTAMPTEVREHLKTWVNGANSLLSIATDLKQDPLELAKTYDKWRKQNWIQIVSEVDAKVIIAQNLRSTHGPVVLSVDDSAIVQVSIQRAISDRYTVICAKNAVEALNLLNTRKVELMLLDVTMPDIDGLELCRTIRNIAKFKNLPVIMLTAKDGLIDKVKGQFAGSTHYLTKPVDREKLLPILEKYIAVKEVAV